jgi:hypothetical protein
MTPAPLDYSAERFPRTTPVSPGRVFLWAVYYLCWVIGPTALALAAVTVAWEKVHVSELTRVDDDVTLLIGVFVGLVVGIFLARTCRGRAPAQIATIAAGLLGAATFVGLADASIRSHAFLSDLAAFACFALAAACGLLSIAGGVGLYLARPIATAP